MDIAASSGEPNRCSIFSNIRPVPITRQILGYMAVCIGLAMPSNQVAQLDISSAAPYPLPTTFFINLFLLPYLAYAMADPFSIAGSAVGVISLGIVACEQLFALVDNVKTARDKAEAIRASLDSLETHLEELEIVLKRLDPTTPIAATSAAVLACNAALARIRHRLPGSNAKDSRIPSNFRSLSFHLSYPLKKADLEYLQSLAKDVHRELQTAQLTMLM
jgi:hypothetical protein